MTNLCIIAGVAVIINHNSRPVPSICSSSISSLTCFYLINLLLEREMGDFDVDFFHENLKQLIMSSGFSSFIREKLESLEEEIEYMRGFLKDTEKKRNKHLEVMNLVRQIKDVVFEAENIIERFVVQALKANQNWDHLSLDLESVKKKIKTLTAKVKQIYDENMYEIYGVAVEELEHCFSKSEGGGSSPSGRRNTSKVAEKKVVVGFKEEVETLMGKLLDSGEGGRLEIISIVGAAGGGKTTLAREVYDHPLISHSFEIRAWVNVSQDYNKTMQRYLLIPILELASPKYHGAYGKSSEDKLGEDMYKCLKGKKYLIVMDDIWGIEAWNDIQRSFPKERKGSKVLFTSRQLVQPDSVRCVPHYLAPLPKSCSWELLQKKVFGKKRCPPELVGIGKQIAGKCEGLPLGIVAIAGILVTVDKTIDVWEEVAEHLSSIIATKQKGCMEILELSYNHLPLHLKVCFLYIGAYPKDYEISIRELIWLWIAEGFIQQSEQGRSLEDVAEDYLISLVDRSLIMVDGKSKSHGGIKACRIHDLLRELCLKKAKEYDFLVQIYRDDSFSPCATNKHRRLFIGSQFFHKFSSSLCALNLRSFVCLSMPNSSHSWLEQNLSFFVENFELLKVLHLIPVTSLGEIRMGDLVHLRYIGLTLPIGKPYGCGPTSFHYLWYVETFNLQVSSYRDNISLPCDIVKMVKLRHLYTKSGIFEYHHVSYDEDEGNILDSLQTLHRMCICECCLRFLKRTPNLKKLGLDGDNVSMLPDLEFLKYLEILNVVAQFDDELVASTGLKLPPTLTRLTLRYTSLKWQELSIILQNLPRLEVLKLFTHACVGSVWNTSELEEGFSQLKYLMLEELDLEEWNVAEKQFSGLEVLVIRICRKLERIPIEFAELYELREIKLEWSTHSAEESAIKIQEKQRSTKGDDDCLNLITRLNDA